MAQTVKSPFSPVLSQKPERSRMSLAPLPDISEKQPVISSKERSLSPLPHSQESAKKVPSAQTAQINPLPFSAKVPSPKISHTPAKFDLPFVAPVTMAHNIGAVEKSALVYSSTQPQFEAAEPRYFTEETPQTPFKIPNAEPLYVQQPAPQFTAYHRTPNQTISPYQKKKRKSLLPWFIVPIGIVASAVAVLAFPSEFRKTIDFPEFQKLIALAQGKEQISEPSSDQILAQQQEDATKSFHAFASADAPSDFLPLIWNKEIVAPLIEARPAPQILPKNWTPPKDLRWTPYDHGNISYGILDGTLPNNSKFSAWFVVLSRNQLFLDWKATTAYSTATFEELEQQRGNPREIRAKAILSSFYTAAFPQSEYQSYLITSPDGMHNIWGYARKESPAHHALSLIFNPGSPSSKKTPVQQKITLRLALSPQGAQPNQWLIVEILHDNWLTF